MALPKSSANSNWGKSEQKDFKTPAAVQAVVSRNLISTSPTTEQFEPTDARPVNAHKTMAGGA